MAIISDYQEETQTSSSSQTKPSKPIPFSSTFDPSNPTAFLENVFDFIAKESTDFFDNDSAEKVVLSAVRAVKVKKAKAVAAEKAKIAVEEKAKVDKAAAAVAAAEKKAMEVDEKEDEKTDGESGLAVPNQGNGMDLEKYSWTQTLQELNVNVPVPNGTKSRFVTCEIKKNHLKVGIKGQPPIIDGELYKSIKPDECYWSIEDQLSLMHGVCVGVGLPSSLGQPKLARVRIQCSTKVSSSRQQLLESVDKELTKGDDRAALALVKDLQGKPNGLQCFGAARQVPQRLYTLDELKLNGIEAMSLLSPVDTTLGSIERNLLIAAIVGGVAAWNVFGISQQQIFYISLGLLFLWTLDLVSFGGGLGSLVVDTIGHKFSQKYHNRVTQHEAGHFLIAYLVGILPKGYTLSSLDGLMKEGSLNIQAGTAFVDFEFLEEVNSGKVSATTLNKFSCIALAGVCTEYLIYGFSEGGLDDIRKLDSLLNGLGFTQKKADSQVRWSVLNTVLLLRRHEAARSKLAEAMSLGSSVGSCIDIIENSINVSDL